MATVWVYEYKCHEDDDYTIDLFESENDAYKYACKLISSRLSRIYGADDTNSDYYPTFKLYTDAIKRGDKAGAVRIYNDFVLDTDSKRRVYYNVFPHEVAAPSDGPSQFGKSQKKKAHFDNGATCKKCNQHNEYVAESNQEDGTYLCGLCKSLNSVFGTG